MSQRASKWFKTIEKVLCGLFFFAKFVVPILTSGGYVGLSIATLLSQHNNRKSPILDDYIEKI